MGRGALLSRGGSLLSPQLQQEMLAEHEARMKGLETEVKESLRTCFRTYFPSEAEDKPERSCKASREPCEQDSPTANADTQESCL